jgi:ABC-type antimicrobial peptide transport system permease subunit
MAIVPVSQMTFPAWQTFTVRTFQDPGTMLSVVRKTVSDFNPNLLINRLRTQDDELNNNLLRQERSVARISSFFGLLALALSCVGLYGLMSYAVFRRTGEIGLRMALGALPRSVLWMILRESLALVTIGTVIGLCAAAASVHVITGFLYGVSATDLGIYTGCALLLIFVAAMAALFPARRAAKVDPMVALRCE